MPLSAPETRNLLHLRDIALRGYEREDGLFDIEAHLTDKSYRFSIPDRGEIPPGEPLHGMWIQFTVDEDLNIHACEAASDYTPYRICPEAARNFARLAGLRIKPGFLKEAGQRVGGAEGCTHLRELLQQVATTAYQTIQARRSRKDASEPSQDRAPALLNSCYAFASDSPVVQRRWPKFYTGPGAQGVAERQQ